MVILFVFNTSALGWHGSSFAGGEIFPFVLYASGGFGCRLRNCGNAVLVYSVFNSPWGGQAGQLLEGSFRVFCKHLVASGCVCAKLARTVLVGFVTN